MQRFWSASIATLFFVAACTDLAFVSPAHADIFGSGANSIPIRPGRCLTSTGSASTKSPKR
jgi:hypothetical protein